MLLAMKIKVAITAAALASPVALTVARRGSRRDRTADVRVRPRSRQGRSSIAWPATSPATASRRQRRCATCAVRQPTQDHEAPGHSAANMRAASMTAAARRSRRRIGDGGSAGGRRELAAMPRPTRNGSRTRRECCIACRPTRNGCLPPARRPATKRCRWSIRSIRRKPGSRAMRRKPTGRALDRTRPATVRHVRPQRERPARLAGNVWEWTNTCFLRMTLEPTGRRTVTNTNCGVRVVQGAHRTYMTDFIRDPRTGGCAAGVPPANLGFRLVVEDRNWPKLRRMIVANLKSN